MNNAENVLDIPKMTIDEKLTRIQCDLQNTSIKKSGYNKFGNFNYYELEDLLPHILPLTLKYECRLSFHFTDDNVAIIRLKNWKNDQEITVRSPMPDLTTMPKMNIVQVAGTYQTYFKRYLIYDLFCICEHDTIDSLDNALKNNDASSADKVESEDLHKLLKQAIQLLEKKGLKGKEINFQSIKNTIFRMGDWSDEEKKEITAYVREYCKKKFKNGGS